MEIRFPAFEDITAHKDSTVLSAGKMACDGLKPKGTPAEVIETHVHVSWPDGRTHKFVELVPKEA